MTQENAAPEVEQVPNDAQNQQDTDDAFEAAFNNTLGNEPTAETPPPSKEDQHAETTASATQDAPTTTPEATTAATAADATDPADAPVEQLIAGLTHAELKAALAKGQQVDQIKAEYEAQTRKLYGRIGEIQGELKKLMETPKGQPLKITPEKLQRISKEFPELAGFLAEDLSDILMSPAAAPVDNDALQQAINDGLAKVEDKLSRNYETKLLTIRHPDWQQTVNTDDFKLWMGTLPTDVQGKIANSWDSAFLSDALTGFSNWKNRGSQAPAVASAAAKQRNDKRLATAVTPSGVSQQSPPQPSEEDAFVTGFKEARPG